VLEGAGVPAPAGFAGLPESLEIVSYAASLAGGAARLAPATGRADVDAWKKKLMPLIPKLVRPRLLQMPTEDWKDPRDVEYATRAIMAQFGAILRAIL
jgi:glutaredoxin 2